ncbi:MAG: hypothetical protein GQ477_00480 [Nanohaloarchaea archaeon]|nr:hypothetical protein [Candidatus Nanohaloarchaea archaeon]
MTVFVLGCTGSGDTTLRASDVGVVVTEFMFDTSAVYHKEQVNLWLVLENQGEKQVAGDTSVFIYGQTISGDVKHWSVVADTLVTEPKTSSSGMSSTTLDGAWEIPNSDFLPPQPEMGVPGGVATFEATFIAPELEQGESTPYTFYSRVCYPYKTSMLSTLTSSSRQEMRIQQDTSAVENVNTAGPIHVSLGGQQNIVARGSTIPVIFKITDVGGGFPTAMETLCKASPETMDRNKVDVKIEVEGVMLDGSSTIPYGDGGSTPNCEKTVKLINGEAELRCSIPIDPDQPTREYHIRAIADYKYYISSDTKITVDYISE